MEVIRAETMGMCFGVRDALALTRAVPDPNDTTIFGELVHNEAVQRELERRGFTQLGEDDRDGPIGTQNVLVTAHGVSDLDRRSLTRRGHRLIDTTCPLVRRAHDAARMLAAEGRHVIVLGRRDHVEVRGLVGDLESWSVVSHLSEVERWVFPRLGVVCQTTLSEADASRLLDAIEAANPEADIAVRDTICEPTKQRVRALRDLIERVDVMVVVGGRHSNNTKQLALTATRAGRRAIHVTGPDDIDPSAFADCHVVGLTAGTSTEDATIDAVEQALRRVPVSARRSSRPDAVISPSSSAVRRAQASTHSTQPCRQPRHRPTT